MWRQFLVALGLMLVLEGILPFLHPDTARRFLHEASKLDDPTLRFLGLSCMVVGVLILYLFN
jgi:uncharacterized protein YjeT (DUF2065 family)